MKQGKIPISKQTVSDEQIRALNRNVPLMEEEVFYTEEELDSCTVIPKGIFILFEKRINKFGFSDNDILIDSVSREKRIHHFN